MKVSKRLTDVIPLVSIPMSIQGDAKTRRNYELSERSQDAAVQCKNIFFLRNFLEGILLGTRLSDSKLDLLYPCFLVFEDVVGSNLHLLS